MQIQDLVREKLERRTKTSTAMENNKNTHLYDFKQQKISEVRLYQRVVLLVEQFRDWPPPRFISLPKKH